MHGVLLCILSVSLKVGITSVTDFEDWFNTLTIKRWAKTMRSTREISQWVGKSHREGASGDVSNSNGRPNSSSALQGRECHAQNLDALPSPSCLLRIVPCLPPQILVKLEGFSCYSVFSSGAAWQVVTMITIRTISLFFYHLIAVMNKRIRCLLYEWFSLCTTLYSTKLFLSLDLG